MTYPYLYCMKQSYSWTSAAGQNSKHSLKKKIQIKPYCKPYRKLSSLDLLNYQIREKEIRTNRSYNFLKKIAPKKEKFIKSGDK